MRRPLPRLALLALAAGCAHAPDAPTRPTAELVALAPTQVTPHALDLLARFRLAGWSAARWKPREARLSLSLDGADFAAAVGQMRKDGAEGLAIPLHLAFDALPPDAAHAVHEGRPVRLRLRGTLDLFADGYEVAVPADAEAAVAIPEATPPRAEDPP